MGGRVIQYAAWCGHAGLTYFGSSDCFDLMARHLERAGHGLIEAAEICLSKMSVGVEASQPKPSLHLLSTCHRHLYLG